ncbi:hypothetical protein N665_1614s0001 [Sinapis alba]|nr:hypothetical protein N665_1614s0001 [Sinapis alba]
MIAIMQRVVEDKERRTNLLLREEQDAAYRAAFVVDQARKKQRQEEEEQLEREAVEAERKRKEEEEARERAIKALTLGDKPEKRHDVTQVLVRFPNGERKGRRFERNTKIQTLYDYYSLITNFPRTVYGRDNESMLLKDAGLHPQASLFIEIS